LQQLSGNRYVVTHLSNCIRVVTTFLGGYFTISFFNLNPIAPTASNVLPQEESCQLPAKGSIIVSPTNDNNLYYLSAKSIGNGGLCPFFLAQAMAIYPKLNLRELS